MNYNVLTYLIYITVILFVVLYVGATLYKNGEPFVINCLKGDRNIGLAVNKFLLVGYYLVNIGYSIMVLKGWQKVDSFQEMVEVLGFKIGGILITLAIMHYINIISLVVASKRKGHQLNSNINH